MKYGVTLALLGTGTFAAFFIATAPAKLLTGPVSESTPVQFEQVSGTVWRGRAQRVTLQGVAVGPVEWKVDPWRLLGGRLAVVTEIASDNAVADLEGVTEAALSPGGTLTVERADLRAGAEWAFALAALPIAPTGSLHLEIEHLELDAGSLPRVGARLRWLEAGVTYPQPYDLGTYTLELHHQPADAPEFILGDISDQGSPLHVRGQLRVDAGGQYNLDLNVSTEDSAPDDLKRVLPLLGPAGADGSVNIRRTGSIKQYL